MTGQEIKVILNPNREDERRILDYLLYCGKPKSRAIKAILLSYLDQQNGKSVDDRFLQAVREAVREELKAAHFSFGSSDTQGESAVVEEEPPVSAFEFLNELGKTGGF